MCPPSHRGQSQTKDHDALFRARVYLQILWEGVVGTEKCLRIVLPYEHAALYRMRPNKAASRFEPLPTRFVLLKMLV